MSKRVSLIVSFLLAACTGCGVVGSARQACRDAALDDANIDLLFNVAEANLDLGLSKEESVTNIIATCGGNPDCSSIMTTCGSNPDCLNCLGRILDEVYP